MNRQGVGERVLEYLDALAIAGSVSTVRLRRDLFFAVRDLVHSDLKLCDPDAWLRKAVRVRGRLMVLPRAS